MEFVFINGIYLILWIIIARIRSSKSEAVRFWDNGYEFYTSLSPNDQKSYWKEDNRIVNFYFLFLFIFLEIFLLMQMRGYAAIGFVLLAIGIAVSTLLVIWMSLNLQKKYKKRMKK